MTKSKTFNKSFIMAAVLAALPFTASAGVIGGDNTYNSGGAAVANGGTGVGVGIGVGVGGNQQQGQIQGQQQGQIAVGQGGQGGRGGNANSASSVRGSGNSSNTVSGLGGQSQATGNASFTSNDINMQGGTTSYSNSTTLPVATAYAPNVVSTALCKFGVSGGGQGMTFGFSVGVSITDENCMLLEQVRTVSQVLGQKDVAAEMMMAVPAYAEAVKRLKEPRKSASNEVLVPVADGSSTGAGVASLSEERDPIKRYRLGLPPLALTK